MHKICSMRAMRNGSGQVSFDPFTYSVFLYASGYISSSTCEQYTKHKHYFWVLHITLHRSTNRMSDSLLHSCVHWCRKYYFKLAHSKRSVFKGKKSVQPNMMLNTLTAIFKEHYCTYLAQIPPLPPPAESCASLMHNTVNSTTFGILEIGLSMTINIFHQYLAKSWPFVGTSDSWL